MELPLKFVHDGGETSKWRRFNPCFNGITSQDLQDANLQGANLVSILVLMELPLKNNNARIGALDLSRFQSLF